MSRYKTSLENHAQVNAYGMFSPRVWKEGAGHVEEDGEHRIGVVVQRVKKNSNFALFESFSRTVSGSPSITASPSDYTESRTWKFGGRVTAQRTQLECCSRHCNLVKTIRRTTILLYKRYSTLSHMETRLGDELP